MFVITITVTHSNGRTVPSVTKYLAIDRDSGGYPYWTEVLVNAALLTTYDKAVKWLEDNEFTRNVEFSDHTSPPSMIHSGLELSNKNAYGVGVIEIQEVTLASKFHKVVSAHNQRPMEQGGCMTLAQARKWAKDTGMINILSDPSTKRYVLTDSADWTRVQPQYHGWGCNQWKFPIDHKDGKQINTVDHLLDCYYSDWSMN